MIVGKIYFMCYLVFCVVCGDVGVCTVGFGACGVAYALRCVAFVLKALYGC